MYKIGDYTLFSLHVIKSVVKVHVNGACATC